jgi:hypothetical protein
MRTLFTGCGVLVSFAIFAVPALAQQPLGERASSQIVPGQPPVPQSEYWKARSKQVRVGMTRREVERLLPPYSLNPDELWNEIYAGGGTFGSGGSQVNLYYVAPGWQVTACYDYTGIPRDAAGTALPGRLEHADNRLLTPIKLEWRPLERQPTHVDPD